MKTLDTKTFASITLTPVEPELATSSTQDDWDFISSHIRKTAYSAEETLSELWITSYVVLVLSSNRFQHNLILTTTTYAEDYPRILCPSKLRVRWIA